MQNYIYCIYECTTLYIYNVLLGTTYLEIVSVSVLSWYINSQLILGFGVEILGTKLKLRKVVRESLVIAHVKVPKNPLPGFPFIAKIQDGRHEIQLF